MFIRLIQIIILTLLIPQKMLAKIDTIPIPVNGPWEFGAALNLNISILNKGNPGILSLSAAISLSKNFRVGLDRDINLNPAQFRPGFQVAVNMYNNGLGTNLSKRFRDEDGLQIDIINSFILNFGVHNPDSLNLNSTITQDFKHRIRVFSLNTASAVEYVPLRYNMNFAYNIIWNNHNRNQEVWFLGLDLGKRFRLGMYNDGPPFDAWGLGDSYDRWWTGGGFVEINLARKNSSALFQNKFFYNFDRFTGDTQDAYETSKVFGLNNFPTDRRELLYNQGRTSFGIINESGIGVGVKFLGQFNKLDIQNKIHDLQKGPYHSSSAKKHILMDFYFDSSLLNQKWK